MKDLIAGINDQIKEAVSIGEAVSFNATDKKISNILVCGLGGSGIGGVIVSQLLKDELCVPFVCVNDYNIPAFVNENTLVIGSSYSGNTEETIATVEESKQRGAEICIITSGGELGNMAKTHGWNHAIVPGGEQPRAMLAYSIIQQLYMLYNYGLISDKHIKDLSKVPPLIDQHELEIQKEANKVAETLHGNVPVIYADSAFGGVATRVKQQINENSKELCWDHVLPEMTHNELVGWAGGKPIIAPVYLATDYDHPRTTHRWNISKEVISKYSPNISEIRAKGTTRIEQVFYLIHITDWVSYYLSELKGVDPVEVEVIAYLKGEMAKR
ncbi:MAG: bifunctional phosphoglucose/phosphomannose isomerase [Crocinitomicaceae bacterium]|nr:bifunctional phosphoglucose/phosphomannose isomerase [Crocinitomicaceae bacterium]